MQKELLEEITLNREAYQKTIIEAISDNIYQCERYSVNFTLAIGATLCKIDIKDFSKKVRKTDKFIILDDHICCAVFAFTDSAQGIKAASNLLSEFEMQFFSEEIYLSVINAEDCESAEKQVEKLLDILDYAIRNGMHNIPLDSTSF